MEKREREAFRGVSVGAYRPSEKQITHLFPSAPPFCEDKEKLPRPCACQALLSETPRNPTGKTSRNWMTQHHMGKIAGDGSSSQQLRDAAQLSLCRAHGLCRPVEGPAEMRGAGPHPAWSQKCLVSASSFRVSSLQRGERPLPQKLQR